MNKALLLILFVFITAGFVQAQNFKIEPLPAYGTADLQDPTTYPGDVVAHAMITNLSTSVLRLSWSRTEITMPEGWTTGICDINYCYGVDIGRKNFELQPGQIGLMDVHAYPGGIPGSLENGAIPGEATIQIFLTNMDDNTDTLSGMYHITVTGDPIISSTTNPEVEAIKLFPNPTTDYFELTNASNLVEQVDIYNILGRRVYQFNAEDQRFDVSKLPHGLYLVSLTDKKEKILKTVRLQKR